MKADKINELINRKNDELERNALDQAAQIINEIAAQQQAKQRIDGRIAELRAELKELEIASVKSQDILGE